MLAFYRALKKKKKNKVFTNITPALLQTKGSSFELKLLEVNAVNI